MQFLVIKKVLAFCHSCLRDFAASAMTLIPLLEFLPNPNPSLLEGNVRPYFEQLVCLPRRPSRSSSPPPFSQNVLRNIRPLASSPPPRRLVDAALIRQSSLAKFPPSVCDFIFVRWSQLFQCRAKDPSPVGRYCSLQILRMPWMIQHLPTSFLGHGEESIWIHNQLFLKESPHRARLLREQRHPRLCRCSPN